MKTVLFIEEALKNSIVGFEGFLGDAEKEYDICVCPWYTDGLTPDDVVPDLESIVADDTSWRAIILADLSAYGAEGTFIRNPFDFLANGVAGPMPVLTLAQILGGVPKQFVGSLKTCKEVEEAYDYQAEGLQGPLPVVCRPSFLTNTGDDEIADVAGETSEVRSVKQLLAGDEDQPMTLPVFIDRLSKAGGPFASTPSGFENGDTVVAVQPCMPYKRHHVRWGRPSELFIVTPRNIPQDYTDIHLPTAGETEFWMRNSFPSHTRYVVVDRPEPPTVADDYNLVLLLVAALQLAAIEFSSGEVEAYKLYKLTLGVDRNRLSELVSRKNDLYKGALDVIPRELRRIYAESRPANRLVQDLGELQETIECTFGVSSPSEMYADAKPFKLTNGPVLAERDQTEWKGQYRRMRDAYKVIAKNPRRSVRSATERFNLRAEGDDPSEILLSQDQIEDLSEQIRLTEFKLAETTFDDPFDVESFEKLMAPQDETIKAEIEHRPTNGKAVFLAFGAFVPFLVGCIPYIFGLAGGTGFRSSALALSLGCAAFLVLVCLIGLLIYRKSMRDKVRGANEVVESVLGDMRDSARRFGQRLSDYATFRNCYPVLRAQKEDAMGSVDSGRIEEIKLVNAELARGLEENDKLMCVLNCPGNEPARRVSYTSWNEVERDRQTGVFDSFFCEDTRGECEFNGSYGYGRVVDAPYDFIRDINLQALRLHDSRSSAALRRGKNEDQEAI